MGDRVSISFRNGKRESVALFHHWGGKGFPALAVDYAEDLMEEVEDEHTMPLERLEPPTVMLDFIRFLIDTKTVNWWDDRRRIMSSLYLGKNAADGDNSDNGHYVIDLSGDEPKVVR